MKKLQNNFTTPEQSKRLLELGVPAWTADGFRWDFSSAFGISEDKRYSTSISVICYEYQRNFNDKLPCWSVGRLIEIFETCTSTKFERWSHKGAIRPLLEDCIEHIKFALNPDTIMKFDFSILDE